MAMTELLTNAEMRRADAATIAAGTEGFALMRRAGEAVAARALARTPPGTRILVLCGPGNNGGDGFVAAARLAAAGRGVAVALLGSRDALSGDAARAAAEWGGAVGEAAAADPAGFDLVIDALFGAGLSRPVDGEARALIERVNGAGVPVLAVDVPSGLDGDSGAPRGVAVQASETVTFARLKPGHLLLPGRALCGPVTLAEIGIPDAVVAGLGARTFANGPDLWRAQLPRLTEASHKYTRGHAVVVSGPATRTGAARLAARGALRIGAGLVTLVSPQAALAENAAQLTAVMLRVCNGADDLEDLLVDERLNAIAAGPGLGTGGATRNIVRVAAEAGRALVLDADALTSFKGRAGDLARHLRDGGARAVLTPHAGEFGRLFDDVAAVPPGSKLERARAASSFLGAVLVFKGADTVIAAPDGRAAINRNGTPYLGTAGSGDVLTGLVTGLLAQGMPAFEAACAAVWMHAEAGRRHGPGLIAEDLPELMPRVLAGLLGWEPPGA
ncbi:carbohydrate kinase, YjeF related protein [Methylobacterium sp. 4-46]|uniref:bifunctional ADP-dependent NAD(P)H-hydrate dehydratase/NAD(P)H-hydrate epimerase n=1 Tax=unclassified Methylobacterium TaxID=2615210 RepID=UPI000165CB3D|nr:MULTISPECIES: bifunctional ADP-dependent NAD(P)H-hydrate dehydratase/NAD(P)H-hydrate epimerase [Methylobacterium]ACA20842.1 carbohydrate kinase, YjeF related protein [Methylobacterium sp. 4-46]WFT79997.1 bifunctional ADP-dependent NAD(P)H-hydrate dehydratase/NAD(P)H-hydrate epimerase [Methylobacterium nodulans]